MAARRLRRARVNASAEPVTLITRDPEIQRFETARLLLRPRTLADTDACLAMDRDPEVVRFVDGPWSDPIAHRAFVEARTRGAYPFGLGYWTIAERDRGDFLGWVLLIPLDARCPEVEIGWRLRRAPWGRGFAAEAAAPVLRHGLDTLGLPEVVADIDPANTASVRVAEKVGMRRVGSKPYPNRTAMRYASTHAIDIPR